MNLANTGSGGIFQKIFGSALSRTSANLIGHPAT